MKKKYLKTVEDVLELKDTDTKILVDDYDDYYKFVDGIFCRFDSDGDIHFNAGIVINGKVCYILEEEPTQEATEEDINKLCLFKSKTEIHYKVSILKKIVHYNGFDMYETEWGDRFGCCRRLSTAEVSEITGYKVEEK